MRKDFAPRRGLRSDVAFGIASRIAGIASIYVLSMVITRSDSAAAFGEFSVGIAVITIGSILAKLGTDAALMRLHAAAIAAQAYHDSRRTHRIAYTATTLAGGAISAATWLGAEMLAAKGLDNADLATTVRWAAAGILPLAWTNLLASSLRGFNQTIAFSLVKFAAVPVGAVALVAGFTFFSLGLDPIALYVVALALTAIAGASTVAAPLRKTRSDARESAIMPAAVMAIALPLMLVSSGFVIIHWTDTLMLSRYATQATVGHYQVAFRYATLIGTPLLVVNAVVAAKFAVLHTNGDHQGLRRLAQLTALVMTACAAPLAAAFMIAPGWFLAWFGADFRTASNTLIILSLAQLLGVSAGSVASILSMTGYQRELQFIMMVAIVTNIALNILFIPRWGIAGAAWTQVLTTIWWNGSSLILVRSKFGFWAGFSPRSLSAVRGIAAQ